ncbi:Serum response factor-binding protein 1 [Gryllus bimaculatus]|nr:Serum response factor-binding protein 1 [Gryllus bimaculatus]
MDKWVINNYIVQMRHSVSQARVHVLNKLVREIRKLQNKKGTDEQKQKNSRKAERLRQEVIFIKKLDPDELSKYALLSTEDPLEMLSKVSLSIEERSKVRLAAHKSIIHQVEIFRTKYPEWALKLPPLLVQLGLHIKYKKKAKSQESNSVTAISNMTRNNRNPEGNCETENMIEMKDISSVSVILTEMRDNEKSKQRSETENKIVTKESANLCVKRSKEKTKEKNEKERKSPDSTGDNLESECQDETTENEDESMNSESEDKIIESENVVKSKHNPRTSRKTVNSLNTPEKLQSARDEIRVLGDKFERKKKINGIAEVRRFADLLESDGNSQNESPTEEDEVPNPTNSVSDPFFLTEENSGESGDELNSSEEEEDEGKNSFRNRDQFFFNTGDKRPGRRFTREKNQSRNFEKKNTTTQWYSRGDQKVPTMNRKQRRLLEKGRSEMKKGSTFSQASSYFPKRFEDPGRTKSLLNPGRTNNESCTEKQEVLHPSWEAKRKQREQILPFQGKKIKFEDDD